MLNILFRMLKRAGLFRLIWHNRDCVALAENEGEVSEDGVSCCVVSPERYL